MARIYLRFGNNEQLKCIAQEIIIDQLQEMNVMRWPSVMSRYSLHRRQRRLKIISGRERSAYRGFMSAEDFLGWIPSVHSTSCRSFSD